jgi:hypothetical protein
MLSLRQPDQVGRVKVAQHPGLRRVCELSEQIVPDQQEVGLHVAGQGHALSGRYHSCINPTSIIIASLSNGGTV